MIHDNATCLLYDSTTGCAVPQSALPVAHVAVNAAFLDEIKGDNLRLRQLLTQIAAILEDGWPTSISVARFVGLVIAFRDQLGVHFDLEETYGYLDDVLEIAPQLSRLAESVRAQHRGVLLEISDVADQACQLA